MMPDNLKFESLQKWETKQRFRGREGSPPILARHDVVICNYGQAHVITKNSYRVIILSSLYE